MRRALWIIWLLLLVAAYCVPPASAFSAAAAQQAQIVDRIVVPHRRDDIITLSGVRELAGYQQLLDGQAEPDDKILNELIEQWVVNNEATAAGYPEPAESEVNRLKLLE